MRVKNTLTKTKQKHKLNLKRESKYRSHIFTKKNYCTLVETGEGKDVKQHRSKKMLSESYVFKMERNTFSDLMIKSSELANILYGLYFISVAIFKE